MAVRHQLAIGGEARERLLLKHAAIVEVVKDLRLEDEEAGVLWADMDPVPIPHNYFQRIENATDEVHIMFAHGDLFKSLGIGIEDIAVAELVYQRATAAGIGRRMFAGD